MTLRIENLKLKRLPESVRMLLLEGSYTLYKATSLPHPEVKYLLRAGANESFLLDRHGKVLALPSSTKVELDEPIFFNSSFDKLAGLIYKS